VGKFTPGSTACDFGYGGAEKTVPDFQLLVMSWEAANGGFVPPNAVQGGWDTAAAAGKYRRAPALLLPRRAKGWDAGIVTAGQIRPGFSGCLVPYSGTEIAIGSYEVLVNLNPAMPLATISTGNGIVPQDAIRAGTDADGTPLYLCSAYFNGSTQLGKLRSGPRRPSRDTESSLRRSAEPLTSPGGQFHRETRRG
jgi:hypothetical protein